MKNKSTEVPVEDLQLMHGKIVVVFSQGSTVDAVRDACTITNRSLGRCAFTGHLVREKALGVTEIG